MTEARDLFWLIVILAVCFLILAELVRHNDRKRRRRVVMMARPMTKYEREHR